MNNPIKLYLYNALNKINKKKGGGSLKIKNSSNKNQKLYINKSDTTQQIKQNLLKPEKIPSNQQKLFFPETTELSISPYDNKTKQKAPEITINKSFQPLSQNQIRQKRLDLFNKKKIQNKILVNKPNIPETPLNIAETPLNIAETPLNIAETPLNIAETPLNIAEIPLNIAETPLNIAETPLNIAETPLNIAETPLNIAETPLNIAETPLKIPETPLNIAEPNKITSKIFKIFTTIIIFGIIYLLYRAYYVYNDTLSNLTDIKKNWNNYKCQLHIIPIAGFIGPEGTSTTQNAINCSTAIIHNVISIFMKPIFNFFEKILDVLIDLVKSVQNIRQMFNYLRESINSFLLDIGGMLHSYATKFSLLFNRLMQTFHQIFNVFTDILFAVKYASTTLLSIWHGPIGGIARTFCFYKNTPITMYDGSQKIISEIKVGDKIKNGKIIGIHIFSGKNIKMYNYHDIIVASDHLVYENSKWIRIKNSKFSYILDNIEDEIYCLTTSTGKILINMITFADYMEIETLDEMNNILNIAIKHLNNTYINNDKKSINIEKVSGFQKNTLVTLKSGITKNISQLKINDNLGNNNIVIGITKVSGKKIKLYKYNDIISSGNVIIKKENEWNFMKNIGKYIKNKKSILYHIFTTSGEIIINNITYKDYDAYQNNNSTENIYKVIDNYTKYKLNSIYSG